MNINSIALALLCMLLFVFACLAPESLAANPISHEEYTLTPPDGYELCTDEQLQLFSENARRQVTGYELSPYILGMYRPATSEQGDTPYILVQWFEKGRRPLLSELREIENADVISEMKKSGIEIKDLSSRSKIGQPRYYEYKNVIWLEMQEGTGDDSRKNISATFPTEIGLFQVTGSFSMKSEEYKADLLAFCNLVDSVKFPKAVTYNKYASSGGDMTSRLISMLIVLLILLVVTMVGSKYI